jgi:hypothetical protein
LEIVKGFFLKRLFTLVNFQMGLSLLMLAVTSLLLLIDLAGSQLDGDYFRPKPEQPGANDMKLFTAVIEKCA